MALMPAVMNSSGLHRAPPPAPRRPALPAGTGQPQDPQELKDTAALQLLGHQDGEQQVPGCSPATHGDDAGVTEPALSPIPRSPSVGNPKETPGGPQPPRVVGTEEGQEGSLPTTQTSPLHPTAPPLPWVF